MQGVVHCSQTFSITFSSKVAQTSMSRPDFECNIGKRFLKKNGLVTHAGFPHPKSASYSRNELKAENQYKPTPASASLASSSAKLENIESNASPFNPLLSLQSWENSDNPLLIAIAISCSSITCFLSPEETITGHAKFPMLFSPNIGVIFFCRVDHL